MMTHIAQLCVEAVIARDAILGRAMTNEAQARAGHKRESAIIRAIEATGMDYNSIMARGEEELHLMEASEG